jgi:hypothetical protein
MSFEEFIERLKARISAFFNSENKFVRLVARLGSLALFAVVVSTIAPTIADELGSPAEIVQPAEPAPAPTPSTAEVEAIAQRVSTEKGDAYVMGVQVTMDSITLA